MADFKSSFTFQEKVAVKAVNQWIPCPACGGNTRMKVREDTVLYHQPLFCPKCRREYLVNVKQFKTQIVNEPDAKTQS